MNLAAANDISNNVLNSVADDLEDIVVDAPPGSGKTYLLESCVALNSMYLSKVSLVGCNTNEQADDLTGRMASRFPSMQIIRLMRSGFESVPKLAVLSNVTQASTVNVPTRVIVTTTAKLIESPNPPHADLLMFDEAYQLKHSDFMLLRGLAPRAVMIGDPGQIDPIVQIPVRHWASQIDGPHLPAPRVALARNEARRFQLPLSRRLPTDSADIVRDAFYQGMTFTGLATPSTRRLQLRISGMTKIDGILDAALACGSLSAITLPARHAATNDTELVELLASLVLRLLGRDAVVFESDAMTPLQARDIGIVVSRREQVSAIAQTLGPSLTNEILIETANRFQGLERKIILTIHPLSGILHPTEFNLNPGRMCVSMSRHKVACIMLTRQGISDTLAGYMPEDDRYLGQQDDHSFTGWCAHQTVWRRLEIEGRLIDT